MLCFESALLASHFGPCALPSGGFFWQMLRLLRFMQPGLDMFSRTYWRTTLIPLYANLSLQIVLDVLAASTCVFLSSDGWSSCQQASFIAVTAIVVFQGQRLKLLLHFSSCDVVSKDAAYQSKLLSSVIDKFKLRGSLVGISTDSAADICKAISLLGVPHFPCLAHIVSTVMADAATLLSDFFAPYRKLIKR
jgi:hypothetical protein